MIRPFDFHVIAAARHALPRALDKSLRQPVFFINEIIETAIYLSRGSDE